MWEVEKISRILSTGNRILATARHVKLSSLNANLFFKEPHQSGADLGGGCRGCAPPPPWRFLIQLVFCQKMWFIGVHQPVTPFLSGAPLLKKVLDPPLPVYYFHLICPRKQYLAGNISPQCSNCNIFGLTDTVALFANKARFFQIYGVLPGLLSPKRSRWWPPIFYISGISNSSSSGGK